MFQVVSCFVQCIFNLNLNECIELKGKSISSYFLTTKKGEKATEMRQKLKNWSLDYVNKANIKVAF